MWKDPMTIPDEQVLQMQIADRTLVAAGRFFNAAVAMGKAINVPPRDMTVALDAVVLALCVQFGVAPCNAVEEDEMSGEAELFSVKLLEGIKAAGSVPR